jgi:6-phosphogluconolactonase
MLPLILLASMAADSTVYIGTRTREGRSQGIYRMQFNPSTGALSNVQLAATTVDPSFLAIHPTRKLLFAVVASPEGMVRSFEIEPSGNLRLLNEVTTKGAGPAHVQIDRSGKWVAIANYTSGSTAVYRIEADGKLSQPVSFVQHEGKSIDPACQAAPHAHSVNFSLDNKLMYVADLGLDEVKVYAFDSTTGSLTPQPSLLTPKGGGPRHLALGKKRIYVLNEMGSSISVFESGKLLETVSMLPDGFKGPTTAAEVVINAKESVLYASNRGADTIAVFRIGKTLTKIADVAVGKVPRGFVLSPDGKFLLAASQNDDTIQSYRVDPKSGNLTPVGDPVKAGSPICLRFAPQ